jgi:NADPH dehydrogenase (quinone)
MKTPEPGTKTLPLQPDRRDLLMTGLGVAAAVLAAGTVKGVAAAPQKRASGKTVLLINAHQKYPGISEGRMNKSLVDIIATEMEAKGHTISHTYIEQGYDIAQEVQKHLRADIIITQSPVFWFGNPAIYKKYIDEVFTAGMVQQSFLAGDGRTPDDPSRQYGSGGKLQGKQYMLSLTMNAPKEAFDDPKQILHGGRSLEDLFAGNTSNYKFCGAEVLPIFACYNVIKVPDFDNNVLRLKHHLTRTFG